jgi:phospholipid/cholesterol/gamma-HCH transport system permease protein
MSASSFIDQRLPRAMRMKSLRDGWREIGDQTRFYGQAVGNVGYVFANYRTELARQIAAMSLGTGALALIGGTAAVITFITMSNTGALASQAYNQLSQVGVEALNGFASAFVNTRIVIPFTANIAFAATIGAGATAQLGAMRINEEVDALEVIGIRSIAYLASTRVAAAIIVVIPLFGAGLVMGYASGYLVTTLIYGQSSGVYKHYFNTFLIPGDVVNSFAVVIAEVTVIMLLHTYYGLTATGGPAGVGRSVGRAVRASLIFSAVTALLVSLALYGQTGNFNFAG